MKTTKRDLFSDPSSFHRLKCDTGTEGIFVCFQKKKERKKWKEKYTYKQRNQENHFSTSNQGKLIRSIFRTEREKTQLLQIISLPICLLFLSIFLTSLFSFFAFTRSRSFKRFLKTTLEMSFCGYILFDIV